MSFVVGYVAFLAVFGLVDLVWLSTMAGLLYRTVLGDLLLDRVRWAPALTFYLGFPLGVIHFGLMPALRAESAGLAFTNGALLGLLAFATYDLTNYATLRPWTLAITLADLAYGTIAVGIATLGAYGAVRLLSSWGWL